MTSRARQNQEEFIAILRDSPCLWLTTSRDYRDRAKREAAYERLVDKMRELEPLANKDLVAKRINNLRSSFRKELKKIKESLKTAGGDDEVYQPKLWYFELLRFLLMDRKTPRPSRSNLDNVKSESEEEDETTPSDEGGFGRSNEPLHADDARPPTRDSPPQVGRSLGSVSWTCPTPPEIVTSAQRAVLTAEVQTANEHFRGPRPPDDRHDVFGKNVANVLRDVPSQQRILAEKFINDVLFQAQMGTLSTSFRFVEERQLSLPQQQEISPLSTQSASSSSGRIP